MSTVIEYPAPAPQLPTSTADEFAKTDLSNVNPETLKAKLGLTGPLIISGGSADIILEGVDTVSGGTPE